MFMFKLVERRKSYFLFSGIVILIGIVTMIYSTITTGSPVQLSIDFTGGTLFSLQFEEATDEQAVRRVFEAEEFELDDIVVQELSAIEGDEEVFPDNSRWDITLATGLTEEQHDLLIGEFESQVGPIHRQTADILAEEDSTTFSIQFENATDEDTIRDVAARSMIVITQTEAEEPGDEEAEIDTPTTSNWTIVLNTPLDESELQSAIDDLRQEVEFSDSQTEVNEETNTTTLNIEFTDTIDASTIRSALEDYTDEIVSSILIEEADPIAGENVFPEGSRWSVRTDELNDEQIERVLDLLREEIGPLHESAISFSSVSASVGEEVTQAAFLATLAASVVILTFMIIAFRSVPHAFRYGACAIAAMVHDITIMLSVISIMGLLFDWQVDALFLTALLTVVGFSVQDTIVVFDRIRENLPRRRSESYELVVNRSVIETVHRSLATQLNAIFIMIAIVLFGGESIRQFVIILLVGMSSGTYSSIFIAVPLLVAWSKGEIPFIRGDVDTHQH
jgi:preprotein translocase SecF subunit